MRPAEFAGKVVMITGASAGVGRAAARAFTRAGARVALIARDPGGLEETRAELIAAGGDAQIFPADVADAEAVFAAAAACETQMGPIDIWVNNAMAAVFSSVDDLTPGEIARVTDVTYLGYVHGTLAALRQMRPRDAGTIIQVGSALAYRGIPLQAAYCGAKHAIRGFTDALRTELIHARSGIALTAVHLPAMNTPQFDWARTHRDRLPRPVAPVYEPERAARALLQAARRPDREYWLGVMTPVTIFANMFFPGLMDRYLAARAVEGQDRASPVGARHPDNLETPVAGAHRTEGAFTDEAREEALLLSEIPARAALVVGGAALVLAGRLLIGRRVFRPPEKGRKPMATSSSAP